MASERFLPAELLARRDMALLAGWSLVKTAGLILLAFALGTWIAALAGSAPAPARQLLGWGLLGAGLRAVGGWGLNVSARRLGLGAKERMRTHLVRHSAARTTVLGADREFSVPVTATLASGGLDKLDDYFTKFIPALVTALVLPPLLGIYILSLDLTSAVILALTIPLVPAFMVLIGLHTQDKVAQSQRGLDALAHQLYELALGLPALLGLGRARAQGNAIAGLGQRYRRATMENLKTVFLSSFWLELISTLSVAVVAVFIGLRLVGGHMELATGLIVLILAPEVFATLREVGSAYHAADDGLAAYKKYRALTRDGGTHTLAGPPADEGYALQVRNLRLGYPGHAPLYDDYRLDLRRGGRLVLDSPSGTGKSTLLMAIAEAHGATGMDPGQAGGTVRWGTRPAVIVQHPVFSEATAAAQLALDAPQAPARLIRQLAERLHLRDRLAANLGSYSPGELRRLEVLRALARIHSDPRVRLLIADEPTAHLDAANAATVRELLDELPADCASLIASHDVLLGARRGASSGAARAAQGTAAGRHDVPAHPATGNHGPSTGFDPVRELLRGQPGSRRALLLGVLSTACAVGLAAVSGWLIVKASYMPPVLHLMVSIVMVRALGIGRAALRYVEQLAIHDAVLGYAATLREKIWNAMVSRPGSWGVMSRSSLVLRYLLAEVDELRDLLARVIFPPLQGLLIWLAGAVVLYLLQPAFGILALAVLLALLVLVIPLMRRIEGRSLALQLEHRLEVNQAVLSILRNRAALRVTGAVGILFDRLERDERVNTAGARRHALGQGVGVGLATGLGMVLALGIVALSTASAELTAVAALLALALVEPAGNAITALQQARGLAELRDALAGRGVPADTAAAAVSGSTAAASQDTGPGLPVHGFELRGVSLGYHPGRAVLSGLSARIEPGQWTALTGPSGSGKSTLLTALLGALEPQAGQLLALDAHGAPHPLPADLLDSVAWCPQEAHLFDSTLARNLALGVDGALPPAARMERVLEQVGLGDWYRQQADGLQARLGSGGHGLSGGQRCRLAVARALLADKQVILLDEPTAHLGHDEGHELIEQLRAALAGRTVVLITHDRQLAAGCARGIALDPVLLATPA